MAVLALTAYNFRLKAAAGQAAPVNELNGAQAFTGAGTRTLVDLGGGVYAWRFSGASSCPTPASTLAVGSGAAAGGGATIIVRYAITTYPTNGDDRILWWHNSSDAVNGLGSRKATGGTYSCYRNGNTVYGPSNGEGSAMRTVVIKLVGNESGGTADEQVKTWVNTTGRSGTAPNYVGNNTTSGTNDTFNVLDLLPTGVGVADVRDILTYAGEVTDAACAAAADNFDAAFAPPPIEYTGAMTLADAVAAGTANPEIPSSAAGAMTLADATTAGTANPQPGVVTTYPFSRNNAIDPTGLVNNALAVLTDDASLTRLTGATGLSQDGSGRLQHSAIGLTPGTSVIVVTREADGKLGVERYTVA